MEVKSERLQQQYNTTMLELDLAKADFKSLNGDEYDPNKPPSFE